MRITSTHLSVRIALSVLGVAIIGGGVTLGTTQHRPVSPIAERLHAPLLSPTPTKVLGDATSTDHPAASSSASAPTGQSAPAPSPHIQPVHTAPIPTPDVASTLAAAHPTESMPTIRPTATPSPTPTATVTPFTATLRIDLPPAPQPPGGSGLYVEILITITATKPMKTCHLYVQETSSMGIGIDGVVQGNVCTFDAGPVPAGPPSAPAHPQVTYTLTSFAGETTSNQQ